MLTIVIAILAGIFLAHIFESAIKAAVLVGLILFVFWIGRGVTFEALTDAAARALYDHPAAHCEYRYQASRRRI